LLKLKQFFGVQVKSDFKSNLGLQTEQRDGDEKLLQYRTEH
jgi:hypothetical protein